MRSRHERPSGAREFRLGVRPSLKGAGQAPRGRQTLAENAEDCEVLAPITDCMFGRPPT